MNDLRELERLEAEMIEALREGDGARLAEIWDEAFVFTGPNGRSLSRDECLEEMGEGHIRIKEAELLSVQPRVFEETGVVVGVIRLHGWVGEYVFDGEYSFVDVYRKAGGRWRAVLSSGDRAAPFVR